MAQFQLGSISTGTLRPADLMATYESTLEAMLSPTDFSIAIESIYRHDEDSDMVCAYEDALQALCPPFVYFGTHPGDGADFGFWPDMDRIEEEIGTTIQIASSLSDFQAEHCWTLADDNVIVQVSDHGNVTVMDMERNVLWSVV